jgi:hypothetical protein
LKLEDLVLVDYLKDVHQYFFIILVIIFILLKQNINLRLKNIYNDCYVNSLKLLPLNECITYYNNFINPDPFITKDSMIKFILACLLNNVDVIGLIIYGDEVISLMFKRNLNPGYVNEKIDYQTDMT